MDLLDWHRDRLTSRRLAVLVRHLPRDSAVIREVDGEAAEWSVTDHLLAAAVDHLAAANWMYASVNTAEDADPPEAPTPVPRPGPPPVQPQDPAPAEPVSRPKAPEVPSAVELARFFS